MSQYVTLTDYNVLASCTLKLFQNRILKLKNNATYVNVTECNTLLIVKLIVVLLVKELKTFYGTRVHKNFSHSRFRYTPSYSLCLRSTLTI